MVSIEFYCSSIRLLWTIEILKFIIYVWLWYIGNGKLSSQFYILYKIIYNIILIFILYISILYYTYHCILSGTWFGTLLLRRKKICYTLVKYLQLIFFFFFQFEIKKKEFTCENISPSLEVEIFVAMVKEYKF